MEQIRAALTKTKQEKRDLLAQMLRIANIQMAKLEETIHTLSLQLSKERQDVLPEADSVDREIRDTVEKILSLDKACSAVANEKLLKYKSEFKSLKKSGQQLNIYAQSYATTGGIYIDTKK